MKTFRRSSTSVNAGSMADIAFLLLIFFLITTTISAEKGILRQLPPECNSDCTSELSERNVLEIYINGNDELLVENELTPIQNIKDIAKDFLNNNGDDSCDYCSGVGSPESSDNPLKAVISLQHASETTYGMFIKVQDELGKAYDEVRQEYSQLKFSRPLEKLSLNELKEVKMAYPFKLSEAKTRTYRN